MAALIRSIAGFFTTAGRHAVPIVGVFGEDWRPVSALAIYWLESLLLALVAGTLCALLHRRFSDAALHEARTDGDETGLRLLHEQRDAAAKAGIRPRDVLMFQAGSMLMFGGFLAGVMTVVIGNGYVDPPSWDEVRQGAMAMSIVIAIGFAIDLGGFHRLSVADIQARVDANNQRWALFWLLGFVGVGLMMMTGRPDIFLGTFAVLKVFFEVGGRLERMFKRRSASW